MSYEVKTMKEALFGNPYVGRGIVIGKSEDGKKAVFAYFIMGRSENSRNRVFVEQGEEVTIYPYDESKVKDPSLIIYSPVKRVGDKVVVTNGDQTDTIEEALKHGKCFRHALKSRCFEPDAPNYTPRISGIFDLNAFAEEIWENLDANNKISLYCRAYDLASGTYENVLINRFTKEVNA